MNKRNQNRYAGYRGKLIETLTGLVTASMYKAKSVTKEYNFFYLEFGGMEKDVEVYPTQEAAHKGFVRRERDKKLAMGRSVTA